MGKYAHPIAIIDDEEIVVSALARVLVAEGFQVCVFTSCSAFLDQGQHVQWGCVLVDVVMPAPNGLDLFGLLGESRAFPIITFSGAGSKDMEAQALSIGAAAHLGKPIDVEDLVRCVAQVTQQ